VSTSSVARPGHIGDHRALLRKPAADVGAVPALDAVLVPSARPAASLTAAADVARAQRAILVVLCSRQSSAEAAFQVAANCLPADRIAAVDLPAHPPEGLPVFAADRIDIGEPQSRDTGAKRNLGIRLALLAGWKQVLFLDDDVAAPNAAALASARRLLARRGGPGAVGWAFDDFPDNSVVCHAHRQAGGAQGTFVGAGGLVLRVDERLPHFPGVYNEDWLFFADLMVRRHRGLAFGGTLRQEVFDPFADPDHARRQEFGDILGEGLFALLHKRKPLSAASSSGYWADYLNVRRRFLSDIEGGLLSRPIRTAPDGVRRDRALECLTEARHTLNEHRRQWELDLPAYVKAWRQDAALWGRTLARTAGAEMDLDQALTRLGLSRIRALPMPPRSRLAGSILARVLSSTGARRSLLVR